MIDKTYILNLREREDRLQEANEEMKRVGFNAKIFHSVKDETNGERGLKSTMKFVFEEIVSKPWLRHILILEDDFEFLKDFDAIEKYLLEVPKSYHLAYLGCNMLSQPEKITDRVLRISAAYSSHAIIYSREGVLRVSKYLDSPKAYDQILQSHIQPMKECYCSSEIIVTQRNSPSDIADFNEYASKPQLHKYLDFEKKSICWGLMMSERHEQMTKHL